MKQLPLIILTFALSTSFVDSPVLAHPGKTAADGCHYCRTNCDQWGVEWDERHCHGGAAASTPTQTKVAPAPATPRPTPRPTPKPSPTATPTPTPTISPSPTPVLTPAATPEAELSTSVQYAVAEAPAELENTPDGENYDVAGLTVLTLGGGGYYLWRKKQSKL